MGGGELPFFWIAVSSEGPQGAISRASAPIVCEAASFGTV